jgi:ABC-type multidrug transport system fused ATPase/permease subunit
VVGRLAENSMLARSLVRLITPTSGPIVLDGVEIATMREQALRPLGVRVPADLTPHPATRGGASR